MRPRNTCGPAGCGCRVAPVLYSARTEHGKAAGQSAALNKGAPVKGQPAARAFGYRPSKKAATRMLFLALRSAQQRRDQGVPRTFAKRYPVIDDHNAILTHLICPLTDNPCDAAKTSWRCATDTVSNCPPGLCTLYCRAEQAVTGPW